MKITFLGTGTSHGVPVIGCKCAVCQSEDRRNKRTRSSIYIESGDSAILIDTATDFHQQAVREGIDHLNAVLYTHAHADHIHGLDEIRIFTRQNSMPIFGSEATIEEVRERFPYIFNSTIQRGGGKPDITTSILKPMKKRVIEGLEITAIPIKHGKLDIFGYRIGDTAYLTDCNEIPESSLPLLKDLELLIIGALRHSSHPTHFSLSESLEIIDSLAPGKALLTHMSHDFDHEKLLRELPGRVEPAYDGLSLKNLH
ncbi:MAG: MBL fold metallo-hydrolase [Spirochaetales bacterium]|nr:MBL fold metallo-hydrolase [Spirochaetales bacterium]